MSVPLAGTLKGVFAFLCSVRQLRNRVETCCFWCRERTASLSCRDGGRYGAPDGRYVPGEMGVSNGGDPFSKVASRGSKCGSLLHVIPPPACSELLLRRPDIACYTGMVGEMPASVEDLDLRRSTLTVEQKRIFLNLRENSRGRYLRIAEGQSLHFCWSLAYVRKGCASLSLCSLPDRTRARAPQ